MTLQKLVHWLLIEWKVTSLEFNYQFDENLFDANLS